MEGADEGVEGAAKPDTKEEPMIRQARGDVARRAHDASRDGVADGHGDTEADAQDLQQRTFVLSRIVRVSMSCREGVGWGGQFGFSVE